MQANKRPQSHGLSHQQIENLKQDQMAGEAQKVKANKNSEYEIPANEEHLVHVVIETKNFDTATGEKLSVPFVQSFYPLEFKRMEDQGAFSGKDVEVIHEPSDLKSVKVPEENKSNLSEPAHVAKNGEEIRQLIQEQGAGSDVVVIPAQEEGGEGGEGSDADPKKPSLAWTKPDLQKAYEKAWGEKPASAMNKEELLEAIQEKIGGE